MTGVRLLNNAGRPRRKAEAFMCNAICYADSLAGKVRLPYFRGGAGSRIRTDDLLITNQLLYQLSYAGKNAPETSATFGV
jgi:hypothetical protein